MKYGHTLIAAATLLLATATAHAAIIDSKLEYAGPASIAEYSHFESPNPVDVSTDPYGKFIVLNSLPKQLVKNQATSSELAVDFPHKEGETIRYSWRIRIPGNFESDAGNRWWLLARWNDQPNTKIGQRESDFLGHNPSIMIGYKLVEGQDTLILSYGIPEAISAGSFSIPRGEWIKLTLDVKWSHGSDGWAKLYINNAKAAFREVNGKNMYGKYQTLFHLGNYRSAEIQTQASLLLGDVTVERLP